MKNIKYTERKYHYFYKITNLINGHYYYGVHNTDNLNDGYMGSGVRLKYAYKKYGCEHFKKEILKYFNSAKEAFEYEAEIVTEDLVYNSDCYNISYGGDGWQNIGYAIVRDNNGTIFKVSKDDERLKTGELKYFSSGYAAMKDKHGNIIYTTTNDERYISGEIVGHFKNCVTVKDKNGHYFIVSKDDERLKTGELTYIWTGRKHSQEAIQKMKQTHFKNNHQQGERNSNYGNCWIIKNNKSIRIPKDDLQKYLNDGWQKGRKCGNYNYININNGKEYKLIHKDKLQEYLNKGWVKGIGSRKYIRLENDIKI